MRFQKTLIKKEKRTMTAGKDGEKRQLQRFTEGQDTKTPLISTPDSPTCVAWSLPPNIGLYQKLIDHVVK